MKSVFSGWNSNLLRHWIDADRYVPLHQNPVLLITKMPHSLHTTQDSLCASESRAAFVKLSVSRCANTTRLTLHDAYNNVQPRLCTGLGGHDRDMTHSGATCIHVVIVRCLDRQHQPHPPSRKQIKAGHTSQHNSRRWQRTIERGSKYDVSVHMRAKFRLAVAHHCAPHFIDRFLATNTPITTS